MSIPPNSGFSEAKWIVSATAGQGTHTTIGSALTAASSGDTIFIRPGTYTENPTLKAGVDLVAYDADALTPNVTISGKCTFTAAGTVSISGIQLQTNSDFLLVVSGSAASIVNLVNCYLNCLNNTGISMTTSSSSAHININRSNGDLGTTGVSFLSSSSAGFVDFRYFFGTNSGSSTTANSWTGTGDLNYRHCKFYNPTSASAGSHGMEFCVLDMTNSTSFAALNTAAIVLTGTATMNSLFIDMISGTASCATIAAGCQLTTAFLGVNSSNTNVMTGAGIWARAFTVFSGTSSGHNVTTEVASATLI
jgi:hypothetical protein